METLFDGRAKLYVTAESLRLRQRRPELFRAGGHRPLDLEGLASRHGLAFLRTHGGEAVVVMVPRLTAQLLEAGPLCSTLTETWLVLPEELSGASLRNVFTGRTWKTGTRPNGGAGLELGPMLRDFPLLLLEKTADE